MVFRTSAIRTLRLLALLIQLTLPSLAGLADARLELSALGAPTHVESEDHDCHVRGHPPDCAICQFLRGAVAAQSTAEPILVGVRSASRSPADALAVRASQRDPQLARGPPHHS